MLLTVLLSSLLLVQVPCAESKVSSRRFAAFLEKIGLQWDQFVETTLLRKDRVTSATQYDETTQLRDSNDIPEHSNGVITDKDDKLHEKLEAICKPRPTAVRVPRTPGFFAFPDNVMLNRCTGSCPYFQVTQHCTVTRQTEITVPIYVLDAHQLFATNVTMYDHTGCACDCIKRKSDCHPSKQRWEADECSCKCLSNGNHCNTAKQNWDDTKCECECKLAVDHCDKNKEWDHVNCGCRCIKSLEEKCNAENKIIDPNTCECNST